MKKAARRTDGLHGTWSPDGGSGNNDYDPDDKGAHDRRADGAATIEKGGGPSHVSWIAEGWGGRQIKASALVEANAGYAFMTVFGR